MKSFSEMSLSPEVLAVLAELEYTRPTPIQAQSLPFLMQGRDLIGQSKTGSGKTAAFAIPILEKTNLRNRELQSLILCPTRELGTQVAREIRKLGRRFDGLQVLVLSGGQPAREQVVALENGVHIAVGTPGRVLDIIQRDSFNIDHLKILVLDEADKMLEMGFEDEINAILKLLPKQRQTVLFSATFPESILTLSRKVQKNPQQVVVEEIQEEASIQQLVYEFEKDEKASFLMRVLQKHPSPSTLIFCNQKATVAEIAQRIIEQGGSCSALSGDLEQRDRDRVMAMFRNGSLRILVATDVAARGLDIDHLDLVINYDLPSEPEIYIHRIGRTGRAGRSGVAVTLARPNEDALKILELEKKVGKTFQRPSLGFKNQLGLSAQFRESERHTLLISGGRKDKLRPGDILGALTGSVGGIKGTDVGKIEIFDHVSYVGISSAQVQRALAVLREGRIKGKKFPAKLVK